jgi:succinate dehydrogenase / fumarate reductase iron-sulfur subunit
MKSEMWNIKILIPRQRESETDPRWEEFSLEIDPDETVLDAVEKIWAFQDKTLTFRHACHHSTCGACGMRVNSVEKLTCITPIRDVARNNGTIKVEPLRNFPVVSDLVVDLDRFFADLESMHSPQITEIGASGLPYEAVPEETAGLTRLVDCIECGLCVSACPVALTDDKYIGPAALAGLQQAVEPDGDEKPIQIADDRGGAWRCHSAFECSAVCPSNVEPGYRIMDLRKQLMRKNFKQWFGGRKE